MKHGGEHAWWITLYNVDILYEICVYIIYAVDKKSLEGIKGRSNVLSRDYKMPRVLSGARTETV